MPLHTPTGPEPLTAIEEERSHGQPTDRDRRLGAANALADQLVRRGLEVQHIDADAPQVTILSVWFNLPVWCTAQCWMWRTNDERHEWEHHTYHEGVQDVADAVVRRYAELRHLPVEAVTDGR